MTVDDQRQGMLYKRMSPMLQTARRSLLFTARARGQLVDSKASWKTTIRCTAVNMAVGQTLKYQINKSDLSLFLKRFNKNLVGTV